MQEVPFDFDEYATRASYEEIVRNSPWLGKMPTMYSPDGKWLYLSSIDIAVKIDDAEVLANHLKYLKERFLAATDTDYKAIACLHDDYQQVHGRLDSLGVYNPEYTLSRSKTV